MIQPDVPDIEENLHLRDYLRPILKHRWLVFAFFTVLVAATTLVSFRMRPVYRASTQLLIDKENPNVVNIQEVLAMNTADLDYYQTQYEVLKSQSLVKRVIEALNLADNPELNPPPEEKRFSLGQVKGALVAWLQELIASEGTIAAPEDPASTLENRMTTAYLDRLKIVPIRNSRLANISFESHDPQLAARVANAHARFYIEQSLERKYAASQDAIEWLTQRIRETQKRLEDSERTLQRYKEENNLVSIDFEERHNIIIQKLSDLSAARTQTQTARIEKERLYSELGRLSRNDNPELLESLPLVIENPLIQRLKAEYVRMQGEYSEMGRRYGLKHPRMIRLKSQIDELQAKLAQEVKKIAQSIETEYRVARAKEVSITEALEEQKHEALELNQKEIHYNVLKREVDTNRNLYESLLKRVKETGLTGGLQGSNISVVDPARAPDQPIKPRKGLNILLSMILGLTLGVGLAFFLEYLDDTIKTPDDVERILRLPFMGPVGQIKPARGDSPGGELVVLQEPRSNVAEALRNVRTNLVFSASDKPPKSIMITSTAPSEGKTFLVANLALVMAQAGKQVLLVDGDLRKPRLNRLFSLEKNPGLSNVLVGEAKLEAALRPTAVEGLLVLPCGLVPPNPSELLGSRRMAELLQEAGERFDYIFFDSPPVMSVTDPVVLASLVEGVVLAVRASETSREPLQRAIAQLREVNARVLGVVLNGVDFKKESYYYGHYYKYYQYSYAHDEKESL